MIAPRVPTEQEIFTALRELGFEETDTITETGRFWRHTPTGRHLQVPLSVQGYFPDWLIWQFWSKAHEIASGASAGRNPPTPPGGWR
jgi:hypothetical protein